MMSFYFVCSGERERGLLSRNVYIDGFAKGLKRKIPFVHDLQYTKLGGMKRQFSYHPRLQNDISNARLLLDT